MKLRKPKHNPYKIVTLLEEEIADYTGAPYVVSVDSCTNALFLCCKYLEVKQVTIPSKNVSFSTTIYYSFWWGSYI